MRPVPLPGRIHDLAQIVKTRAPAEFLPRERGRCDQYRGITRAPRRELERHLLPDRCFNGPHNVEVRITSLVSEVVLAIRKGVEPVQRQDVSRGEIRDVDIITNTRAVRGRVVVAEYLQAFASACDTPDDDRDQVRLVTMVLNPATAPAALK